MAGRIPKEVEGRLSRIEGQVRGIGNMIGDGRSTVDVVTQVFAVQSALKKVSDLLVADHVEQWLTHAVSGNRRRGRRDLDDLLKVLNSYS